MLEYMTPTQVAERLDANVHSVCRATRALNLGIFAGGRLVAIPPADIPAIRAALHDTPGNPEWIAAASPKRRRRPASRKAR